MPAGRVYKLQISINGTFLKTNRMQAKSADGHEWKEGDLVSLPLDGEEFEDEQICENGRVVLAILNETTGQIIYPIDEMGFHRET